MKITKDTVVSLTYILSENDVQGNLIQEVTKDKPFVVLFGAGSLLPKFENELEGLKAGDSYGFSIESKEGYGELNPNAVIELDKDIFKVEGEIDTEMLQVGNSIPMQNDQGQPLNGLVKEIKEDKVVMDFNHPLAGVNLYFTGEILDVREASEEELSHGHVHGDGGVQH
ncbi:MULTISPECIES: peptidylprolyl isomerase [unclassified Lentimicrobium]|uniref:FKBP-type peptidyl-prolyl cis-trans isomerase n=1 Tax=unclassified Lentimicrobium TaxID=2677434 RepID=UPI0015572626|nr:MULTISPECIES: peptidylprolyl isomerase [unclassified Lentimicrobium]NPD46991.1 peptidylprolyl isomerase [Lentimicrobium sp. S6]NPD83916.1 peptidylprolyl isomerase [Lentimicrobium sp. L6]